MYEKKLEVEYSLHALETTENKKYSWNERNAIESWMYEKNCL